MATETTQQNTNSFVNNAVGLLVGIGVSFVLYLLVTLLCMYIFMNNFKYDYTQASSVYFLTIVIGELLTRLIMGLAMGGWKRPLTFFLLLVVGAFVFMWTISASLSVFEALYRPETSDAQNIVSIFRTVSAIPLHALGQTLHLSWLTLPQGPLGTVIVALIVGLIGKLFDGMIQAFGQVMVEKLFGKSTLQPTSA